MPSADACQGPWAEHTARQWFAHFNPLPETPPNPRHKAADVLLVDHQLAHIRTPCTARRPRQLDDDVFSVASSLRPLDFPPLIRRRLMATRTRGAPPVAHLARSKLVQLR